LKEKNIKVKSNVLVSEVTPKGVHLNNGDFVPCDVAVWATGAEPQEVSTMSDLALMKGFFRVNNFL